MNVVILKNFYEKNIHVDYIDDERDPVWEEGKLTEIDEERNTITIDSEDTVLELAGESIQKVYLKE